MYLVFTRMPGESYRRQLSSCPCCLCDVFLAIMNSLRCSFSASTMGLVLFSKIVRTDGTQCGYCLLTVHNAHTVRAVEKHFAFTSRQTDSVDHVLFDVTPVHHLQCTSAAEPFRVFSNACPLKCFNHFEISYSSRLGNSLTFEVYSKMNCLTD